ncbi:MAG TPA: hypothetical protein VKZ53_21180 [Candidatus Angelobacter sp.]|nr:hypothetical protein [Candidatus Angelobacter sp.]
MVRTRLLPYAFGMVYLSTLGFPPATLQAHSLHQEDKQVFHWHSNITSGKTVTVRGINGSIDASYSTDGELHVEAVKTGPEANRVEVNVSTNQDGVLVCIVSSGQTGTNAPCESGRLPQDVRVDFKLAIPAGIPFIAQNINGTVRAKSLSSNVAATTMRGDIEISTNGTVTEAHTNDGSVNLAVGKLWTGLLAIKTLNGNIRLQLPRNVSFQPSRSGNAVITGSGPVQLKGLAVGEGSPRTGPPPELEISTLHGKVTISTGD